MSSRRGGEGEGEGGLFRNSGRRGEGDIYFLSEVCQAGKKGGEKRVGTTFFFPRDSLLRKSPSLKRR